MTKVLVFFLLGFFITEIRAQCGIGSIVDEHNNKCYHFHKAEVDFKAAESVCSTRNSHLVSVHNNLIIPYLTEKSTQHLFENGYAWLGGQRGFPIESNQQWEWTDGTPFDYQNFTNEKTDSSEIYGCMKFSVETGKWLTASCTEKHQFVCASDRKQKVTALLDSCPTGTANRCPSRYVYFEATQSCYKIIIGLFYNTTSNSFENTDGTPVDYTNWSQGQPNPSNFNTYTTIMSDAHGSINAGEWFNVVNENERGFICKKAATLY
ncbi:hypothetical protein CAEBREN_30616 [Caenorhabditis brenneri]|uniref:C-type lectin domain-containing protein n=1 Tax=Caenorhabditis brenneri TaxID=135651 RepID=G0MKF6_CAEBE|nr:hypothetical protein CAEBREN_30616 [Caenorhabditis brenneri]